MSTRTRSLVARAVTALALVALLLSQGGVPPSISAATSAREERTHGRQRDEVPAVPAPERPARPVPGDGLTLATADRVPETRGPKPETPPATGALILYDTTAWADLGELYATMTANLVGRFGTWTAKPVRGYVAGEIGKYAATVYIGSTYDEPLPIAFLDDVLDATRPVVWMNYNVWALTARAASRSLDFESAYGWMWTRFLFTDDTYTVPIAAGPVTYKGHSLDRYTRTGAAPLLGTRASAAVTLATAALPDGTSVPWAVRSRNLTYITEVPFAYINETDRYLAFADLLFDALAPSTATRHRALVRLEDISPASDPARLRQMADYLASQGIPFGFAVSPVYTDGRVTMKLSKRTAAALLYLQSKGGVLVEHGYTHQWNGGINPYNRTTGDDFEFYRVIEQPDATLTYVGPLPEDGVAWVTGRLDAATALLTKAGLGVPAIFETPHYAGSHNTYLAARSRFGTRWERALYAAGLLSGTVNPQSNRFAGQFFPYVVTDVYGSKVLPENLGNIEPEPWKIFPARHPADIEAAARANLVVRDGFAAFYFHPDYSVSYLRDTVNRIRALGYQFVDPRSL